MAGDGVLPTTTTPSEMSGAGGSNEGSGRAVGSGGDRNKRQNHHGRHQQQPRNRPTAAERQQQINSHKVDMRKYDRMIADAQHNFADILQTGTTKEECTICCKPSDLFGVGPCRHPVCMECAIRLRVLGGQSTCPVCRGEIAVMCFLFASSGLSTANLSLPQSKHPDEERFSIRFESEAAGIRYEKYLAHVCKLCKAQDGERLEFATFVSLRQHMAQTHHLSYCHICTDNLSLFSRERKAFNREQLQRHIRHGDPEDKSQKGHPSCLFCDQRFFDEEQRYKHLRKEHFFCQFCEAEGTSLNTFYSKHTELVQHYEQKHFVCDVPECKEAGIAFSTQFDLKIHKSREHGTSRQGLALDFQFSDRQLGRGTGRGRGRDREREPPSVLPPPPPRGVALVPSDQPQRPQTQSSDFVVIPSAQHRGPLRFQRGPAYDVSANNADFPSLPGASRTAPAAQLNPNAFPRLDRVNKNGKAAQVKSGGEEAFPSLGGGASAPSARQNSQNDQWGRHTGGFDVIDDDERRGSGRPSQTPHHKHKHAKASSSKASNAAPAPKPTPPPPPTQPAASAAEDFPVLAGPAPSNNPNLDDGFKWSTRAKNGAVTGVTVPAGYRTTGNSRPQQPQRIGGLLAHPSAGQNANKKKKNKKKVTEFEPVASPPPYVEPPEPQWEDVPVKPKIVKGKKTKKSEPIMVLDAVVPSGFSALNRRRTDSSSEDEQSSSEGEQQAYRQSGPQSMAEIGKYVNGSEERPTVSRDSGLKKNKPTSKKPQKNESVDDFPSLGNSPSERDNQQSGAGGILGSLFSFSGVLSNLTSGWTPLTAPAALKDEPNTTFAAEVAPVKQAIVNGGLSMGPPPGFESVVPKSTVSQNETNVEVIRRSTPPTVSPSQPSSQQQRLELGLFTADDLERERKLLLAAQKASVGADDWAMIPKKVAPKKGKK